MLKIKDMNLNNVIRQGDTQPRQYQLDTGNLDLNLTNKSATIRLMTADFQGIGYETTATVSSENKISFSIDDVIPARQYRLEVTVDDYVFPSRATDGQFNIDPSSHGQEVNIINVIGKEEIVRDVKARVENELEPLVTSLESAQQSELDRQAQEEARESNEQTRLNKDLLRDDKIAQMEADKDAVIANATVDSEVILARGGKATLGQRLDETTAQLAQKADQDKVWSMANMGQDVKTAMTGGSVAVVGAASTDTINLLPNAVTPTRTSFMNESTNIFNHMTALYDKSINPTTGAIIDNPSGAVSEPIFVIPGETISVNHVTRKAFYGGNGEFISSDTIGGTWVVPDGAYTMRLVCSKISVGVNAQANRGDTLLPFELWKPATTNESFDLRNQSVDTRHLKDGAVDTSNTNFIELSSNRFNAQTILAGHSLNSAAYGTEDYGKAIRNIIQDVSDFISVSPNKVYTHNASRFFWYDEDKNAITTSTNKTVTAPSNAYFIRLAINTGTADTTQLNESSTLLPYEPYYIKIDNTEIKQDELNKNDLSDKDFYVERLSRVFESPEMEDAFHIRTKSASDMYALWDGLMSNADTKTKIATDSQGNDLFKYHFKIPTTMTSGNTKLKKPKMVLIGGTHGNEKAAVWTLYTSMKMIIEDWKTDEILELLRWGVEFVIVPIANPSGWNANTRKNGNGIDINRQFPTRWTQFEVDHITYGGEAPLTEPEAIAINNIIETEEDVIYFGDFHNFGRNDVNFIWNVGGTLFSNNIGESLVSSLSNHWKKVIPTLANDGKHYYGYVSDAVVGSMALHAPKRGLQASTIEMGSAFFNEDEEFSGETIKRGVEILINWLTLNRINNIKFYNNR